MPEAEIGVVGGTAQNYRWPSRAGSVGDGAVRRIVSVSPCAVTPAMCLARPACVGPGADDVAHQVRRVGLAPRCSPRSITRRNASAVTGALEGGEKRKPEPHAEGVGAPAVRSRPASRGDLGLAAAPRPGTAGRGS